MDPGLGYQPQNNILGDLVDNFDLNALQDDLLQVENAEQVLNIENPDRVEFADDNLIFELISEIRGTDQDNGGAAADNHNQQQVYLQEYVQPAPDQSDLGNQIMEQITGFGSGVNPPQMVAQMNPNMIDYSKIRVKIVEEPASHKLRFRYECEGRSAGALQGEHSTSENKTFPSIQIEGYVGPAVVVVSCVEEKEPYRAHPHNLVGRGSICKKGVCSMEITNADMTCQFANLGIQCVRKKDAPASLARREQIKVDPFRRGFSHKNGPINLNAIRLCFQVFLKNQSSLKALPPVVSKVIYDKKSHSDLQILEISDETSPVEGGKKILVFCEKVDKNDIEIHFTFTTKSGEHILKKGEFTPTDVHKQYGISFKTPPFPNQQITERVQVAVQLYKPSDQSYSEPLDFFYLPTAVPDIKPVTAYKSEPQFYQNLVQTPKAGPKRGREPKQVPDEPSSGQVFVPPKMSTAQYRGGGGQVTVVNQQTLPATAAVVVKDNSLKIGNPEVLWSMTPGATAIPGEQDYQRFRTSFTEAITKSGHVLNDLDAPTRNPAMAANDLQDISFNTSEIVGAAVESFPNLDLNSGDLILDDLSSNIGDLRIERRHGANRQQQLQQQQQQNNPNPLDSYSNYQQMVLMDQRERYQSSQLQTPDVSMDDSGMKRNNLNKF